MNDKITIPTDAMAEAAAKARWDYDRAESGDTTEWDMRYPSFREFDIDAMRAALEAAAPLIVAHAFRDAAEVFGENQTIREGDVKEWLRIRADKIENGGGFIADYHGLCARRCGGIRPGDRVEYVDAFLPNRHVGACPERTDETEAGR